MPNNQQQKPTEMELKPEMITQERNRYFTGKYMTARDFRAEQEYFLSHQRAHLRMLHGWGVLCGLEIERHWNVDCRDRWLKVKCGVAFDCYGREIDFKEAEYVWLPMPSKRPSKVDPGTQYEQKNDEDANNHLSNGGNAQYDEIYKEPFLLCIQYAETCIDQVAALTNEACDPSHQETNRVRESHKFVFIAKSKVDVDFWKTMQEPTEKRHKPVFDPDKCEHCDDCPSDDKDCDEKLHTCLDAKCKYDGFVPVALITPHTDADGYLTMTEQKPWFDFKIKGRPTMPVPADDLTHIAEIDWPHGGKMRLSELRRREGKLKIRFDRKLLKTPVKRPEAEKIAEIDFEFDYDGDGDIDEEINVAIMRGYEHEYVSSGRGISPDTFMVQTNSIEQESDGQFSLQFVPYQPNNPPHIEGDHENIAVYQIKREQLRGSSNLGGKMIRITLKCDFILDCNRNPIDGNFLGGSFPTGDGVAGGTFESWFYVIDDWEDDDEEKARKGRYRSQNKGNAQS